MTIQVTLGHSSVLVERKVFTALFNASVVASRAAYLKALQTGVIPFNTLVDLARIAHIPYTLFLAPFETVEEQIKNKTNVLLAGVGKKAFSLNSRGTVELGDIELIIKDILRKQELLKRHDRTLLSNELAGCLKKQRGTVVEDADAVREVLGVASADVKAAKNKTAAFDLLVARFEQKQIFVSQSQQDHMPQRIPRRAKFSGMCVRDKKIPFIFMTSGDAEEVFEPAGRKVFTLVLLATCIARGKFVPVTYNDQSGGVLANREFEITEEFLMPAAEVGHLRVSSLADVKEHANTYRVTPTAFLMRARRLSLVSDQDGGEYLAVLRQEFRSIDKTRHEGHFRSTRSASTTGLSTPAGFLPRWTLAGFTPRRSAECSS